MKKVAIPLIALLTFAVASCTGSLNETKKAVQTTADAINVAFKTSRVADETLIKSIEGLYEKSDSLDLSTKGMDVSQGGIYAMFPGDKYYYKTKPIGSALYASPGKPMTEAMKKEVRFMEYVDPFLQTAGNATSVQVTAFYGTPAPMSVALMSPWVDVVSVLSPGLTLEIFEWYNRGLKSPGPPIWSAEPFTDLTQGWVMDVSGPVRSEGALKGVTVISVDLAKVSARYIDGQKPALMLMGHDGTVVGLSPIAQEILKISPLQSVDYLRQVKSNNFAPGKYRLGDPSQAPELRNLAKHLASGQATFHATLNGKAYDVVQQVVPENAMVVVGFSPRF